MVINMKLINVCLMSIFVCCGCNKNNTGKEDKYPIPKAFPTVIKLNNNEYVCTSQQENDYCKSEYNADKETILGYFVNAGFEDEFHQKYPNTDFVTYLLDDIDNLKEIPIYKIIGIDSKDLVVSYITFGGTFFKNVDLEICLRD